MLRAKVITGGSCDFTDVWGTNKVPDGLMDVNEETINHRAVQQSRDNDNVNVSQSFPNTRTNEDEWENYYLLQLEPIKCRVCICFHLIGLLGVRVRVHLFRLCGFWKSQKIKLLITNIQNKNVPAYITLQKPFKLTRTETSRDHE